MIIGALDVQSKSADAAGADDIQVLQILADQLTVAVENARLFRMQIFRYKKPRACLTRVRESPPPRVGTKCSIFLRMFLMAWSSLTAWTVMFFTESDAQGQPLIAQSVRTWSPEEGVLYTRNSFNMTPVALDLQTLAKDESFEIPDLSCQLDVGSDELENGLPAWRTEACAVNPIMLQETISG